MSVTTIMITNSDLLHRAQRKAHMLGLTLSAYVSRLVEKDTQTQRITTVLFSGRKDWGPVPAHVAKRWDEEERQFEEEWKRGSHRPGVKGAKSVKELMGRLDQETHLLDNGKDN